MIPIYIRKQRLFKLLKTFTFKERKLINEKWIPKIGDIIVCFNPENQAFDMMHKDWFYYDGGRLKSDFYCADYLYRCTSQIDDIKDDFFYSHEGLWFCDYKHNCLPLYTIKEIKMIIK